MDKVTYFDVEYANSKNKSICQLGLMCESYDTGEPFYPEKNIYINPEDGFDNMCIKIHGITPEKVSSKQTFPEVWYDIEKYFTNSVIIGHNVAAADLDSLVKNLRRYNIDIPEMYYICTLELAREYVPDYAVPNYSMSSLCDYFDIDIDSEHDAFDDACACADLFYALVDTYSIDIDDYVTKYIPRSTSEFTEYISSPEVRKKISEFYGMVRGFSIDNKITPEEIEYLKEWRNFNDKYKSQTEIAEIIDAIDKTLDDGIITNDEVMDLQKIGRRYLSIVSASPITLATQILDGIMKGIISDGVVTEDECKNLRQWLYDNIYLSGHYPFAKLMEILETALEDMTITEKESTFITDAINALLNPVETLKTQINEIENKHICLSGNFSLGEKSEVGNYIIENGGYIDVNLKKSTDILIIGDCECKAYSNGSYGTKVKKAIEFNEKGSNIQIVKEADFFANVDYIEKLPRKTTKNNKLKLFDI